MSYLCADLTDVTLADEDTNSILTDNANRTFQGNVAMQVTQLCCQIWNQAMQVTSPDYQILNQFARNQKMHILQQDYFKLLSVRKLIQVEMLYPGSVVPLAMFCLKVNNMPKGR